MRVRATSLLLFGMLLASTAPALAQAPRSNAIWARKAPSGSITFDGNLNEAVWAQAESWRLHYRYDSTNPVTGTQGIPGSGWKDEGGYLPGGAPTNDSTNATLKFLVIDNQLYLGATVPDRSIGGSGEFGFMDGLLMGLKDHSVTQGFPRPVMEYLYSWWYPRHGDIPSPCAASIVTAVGNQPIFKGRWAPDPVCDPEGPVKTRTAEQIAAWDARTVVVGTTNQDTHGIDGSYTVEMRFDLGVMGYDVTQSIGDIVEWNISIYDTDNYWPTKTCPPNCDLVKNRTWWQSPWGLIAEQDEVRIYAKPSVTTSSGALPAIDPDFRIPTTTLAAPTIDGAITDAVWTNAPSFDIRWSDPALRASYPSVGKSRSGDYQPRLSINDPEPALLPDVTNGADATIKYFFKGDFLYLAFDARDTRVQSNALEDVWDGFTVSINHRGPPTDPQDHNLQGKGLSFHVGAGGTAVAAKDLPPLLSTGSSVALVTKPGTTVDDTGASADDTGYTAELKVDLTDLGYPSGLGDGTMFLGVTLHDHDRFSNPLSDSYSTRAWWFREREEQCCPAWTYLDPTYTFGTVGVGDEPLPGGFAALGNTPNPFHLLTTLEFALGREANVALEVFDLGGRLVQSRALGRFMAGHQRVPVTLAAGRSGLYFYRLEARDPATGAVMANLGGKMMRLR